MKISTKLYAGFIFVVALTAALGLYISYVNGKSLTEDAGRDAVIQAEKIIKNIDKSIYDKAMEVGATTRRNWVISIVAESNARFEQLENIDGYLAETESKWTAASGDRANALQQELMSNNLANELRDEFITFYESIHGYRILNNLFVTNKYGASIAQTDETGHFRHDKETWWQETRRLGMYIGKIEYDKETNSYGIPASFSIVDAKGNFMGVLKTVIDIKAQIHPIELATTEYETTQITILTNDGRIIYRTKPYRFMGDFSTWQYFNRLQGRENSFVDVSEGNKEKLYSYSRSKGYSHYHGFGWILMLENDLEEIMVPAHALQNRIAITSLLLVLIGATIAFVISSSITRSLTKLNEGTSRIGRGDLNYRLEMESKDEFGQLARSFNTMVQDLRKITASRDELDKEVAERKAAEKVLEQRTYDLDERVKELNCLYEISALAQEPQISLEKIFQRVVELIPPSWRYPEITCARVSWGVEEFRSKNFIETRWRQSRDIVVNGEQVGDLEVFYLEERPQRDEGPFLKEDGNLLKAIAQRLGEMIEHWQAEEELKKHREQLEELIQERTAELNKRILEVEQLNSSMVNLLEDLRTSNENLELTTTQLSDANKELESFSYSVSHDLRAPLRAIDGFSQMLVEDYGDKLEEDGQHQLDVIQSSARDMGHLIDDLLAFSRLGRKEIKTSEIDMRILVQEVFEQLHVGETDGTARLNIDSLPPSKGDRNLIREVYVNLLSNAIKFAKSGETPVIEISGTVDGDENYYSVKDNGVGFDMKYADKLFQVFQRLHSAEEYEGTGIGLALIQRIIHRHGGRVWAEGKVGEGATFYFSLPRS